MMRKATEAPGRRSTRPSEIGTEVTPGRGHLVMPTERNAIRGHLAATVRHHPDHTAAIAELRGELRAAGLAEHIRRAVHAAPPLTAEQRLRLASLLTGPVGGVTDA